MWVPVPTAVTNRRRSFHTVRVQPPARSSKFPPGYFGLCPASRSHKIQSVPVTIKARVSGGEPGWPGPANDETGIGDKHPAAPRRWVRGTCNRGAQDQVPLPRTYGRRGETWLAEARSGWGCFAGCQSLRRGPSAMERGGLSLPDATEPRGARAHQDAQACTKGDLPGRHHLRALEGAATILQACTGCL